MGDANRFLIAKWFLNFVIVLVVILVLVQPSAQDASSGLFGKTWTLTEMEGQKFYADKPNLVFDREQKRVSGSGGCNRFSGTFEIDDSKIKFSRLVSTKMACVDAELQNVENTFLRLLETTTRFELQGSMLRLYANDNLVLVFADRVADSQTGASSALLSRSASEPELCS